MFAGDGQYVNLYRSTDYGENWVLSANLRPLVFATDSNNIVYAGTHDGLFATTDNGLTWAQNNFLSNIPVSSILIDSANNIYCGTGYYSNGNGVFYSTDGGLNWTQLGLAGKIVLSLAFDSQGNLYAGTKQDGLYKTTDLGQTWVQYNQGLYKKDVFRLKLNNEDMIFIGSEGDGGFSSGGGGIFRSMNNSDFFEHIGLPISNVKNIVFSGDSLIFASTPSGVQKYNKKNSKWSNVGLHDVFGVTISPDGILFAATFGEGLFKSTNLGESWMITNLTTDSIMSTYNVLALSDDTVFVATEFNLRKTFDGGINWIVTPIKTGFFSRNLYYFDNIFWVTGFETPNYILYKSTDNGRTFDSVYYGTGGIGGNSIYATQNGNIFVASPDFYMGILHSSNLGLNWSQVLFDKYVLSVFADDVGLVITGSDTIFISTNFGDSWNSYPYPDNKYNYLTDIKKDYNNYYFGTIKSGLYEVDIITSIEDENNLGNNYHLSQNYPNPFNPTTKIKLVIPKSEMVQIKVYNILGKEVKTLLSDYTKAGTYEIEFDASNLPSGVYFYRMISGEYLETKKMILLR
ncbi:MAG: T9SS type A sorting domain-containing protein [Ignavibacteriaceae bacterium]|nr:T9SS type A sorting domain-containing protein [Ignavibacteriaceae bacterium]